MENIEATIKEINERKESIEEQLESLFKDNMKITDWNVPEAADNKAARMIFEILQNKLNDISKDIDDGKYDYY